MAFSAVQSHPLLGLLCIPSTTQSLERRKESLGIKLCFPSRSEIQIIQGVQDRHFQGLAAAGNAPGKTGRFHSHHVSHGDREAGQAGGNQHSPAQHPAALETAEGAGGWQHCHVTGARMAWGVQNSDLSHGLGRGTPQRGCTGPPLHSPQHQPQCP